MQTIDDSSGPITPASAPPGRRPSRWVVPQLIGVGVLVGIVYGATIRLWMRLVTEDPEFSWGGTIFIVGAFAVAFGATGLVRAGRRRGWRALLVPARVVAGFVALPCFVGAGSFMLPTMALGALTLARTDWPRRIRQILGALAVLSTTVVVVEVAGRGLRGVIAVPLYLFLAAFEAWMLAEPYRPSVGRLPKPARLLATVVGAAGCGGVLMIAAGLVLRAA
jgi:hypothetical protein